MKTVKDIFTEFDKKALNHIPNGIENKVVADLRSAYSICYNNLNNAWNRQIDDFEDNDFKFFFNRLSK